MLISIKNANIGIYQYIGSCKTNFALKRNGAKLYMICQAKYKRKIKQYCNNYLHFISFNEICL